MSDWQSEHGFRGEELPVRMIGLRLDRKVLYERINRRCREMVEGGLIEEVRALWERGYGPGLAPLASIGYREIGAYLNGDCSLEQAIADMAQATRRLAKRQLTWFRADPTIEWVDAMQVDADTLVASLSPQRTAAR
jgi:tRNA dimethylallyltransferase